MYFPTLASWFKSTKAYCMEFERKPSCYIISNCLICECCGWLSRCVCRRTKKLHPHKVYCSGLTFLQHINFDSQSGVLLAMPCWIRNIQDPRMNKVLSYQVIVLPIWWLSILRHSMKYPDLDGIEWILGMGLTQVPLCHLYIGGPSYNAPMFLFWNMCYWNPLILNVICFIWQK